MSMNRVTPGVVVARGEHAEVRYGQHGAAQMYHTPFGGGAPVLHYSQSAYGQGFRREYHLGATVVYRNYTPVVWGNSGYTFYGYNYGVHRSWQDGYYYDYCHRGWDHTYFAYNYGWTNEGWYSSPWHSYYGYYFPHYEHYYSPSHWLIDWYFGALLSDYYAVREAEAISAYENGWALDFETKELLREQAIETMQEQQYGRVYPVYRHLNTEHRYVVSEYTPVLTVDGYNCALSHGDVIHQVVRSYEGQETITMIVDRAKRGSCYRNQLVNVDVSQLQEYNNDFNSRVELGMGQLHVHYRTARGF